MDVPVSNTSASTLTGKVQDSEEMLQPTYWVCSRCTLHNDDARTVCEACKALRPQLGIQVSEILKFPNQSMGELEWLLQDPNIASVWPQELLKTQSDISTVTVCKRMCCPSCKHTETSSSSSLDFLALPTPSPEDDRTITFFPANPKHLPIWLMVPAAVVQASHDIRGLKSWMCSRLNRHRSKAKALSPDNVSMFGMISTSCDNIRNGHCLLPYLHCKLPTGFVNDQEQIELSDDDSILKSRIDLHLYAHELVPGKRRLRVLTRINRKRSKRLKKIGVPFYIHVDKNTTHQQVQRMIWERVKFTAWPSAFYSIKQNTILALRGHKFVRAAFLAWVLSHRTSDIRFSIASLRNVLGKIISYCCTHLPPVYPFEDAQSPTTFRSFEQIKVWWENENCTYAGKITQCVHKEDRTLKQVEVLYDDGDRKRYGEGLSFGLENLKERVHQAHCLEQMCPYKVMVQRHDARIYNTLPYRDRDYGEFSTRPDGYLTSSFPYDDKPIYLLPNHHLLVHWWSPKPRTWKVDGDGINNTSRFPFNTIPFESRLPGCRSALAMGGDWTLMELDSDYPRMLEVSCAADSRLTGSYKLCHRRMFGWPRYRLHKNVEPTRIFLYRNKDGLWSIGPCKQNVRAYVYATSNLRTNNPLNAEWSEELSLREVKARGNQSATSTTTDTTNAEPESQTVFTSVEDCLHVFTGAKAFSKEWVCAACNQRVRPNVETQILGTRKFLIIVLARSVAKIPPKHMIADAVKQSLDMTPYIRHLQPKQRVLYDCLAVCHFKSVAPKSFGVQSTTYELYSRHSGAWTTGTATGTLQNQKLLRYSFMLIYQRRGEGDSAAVSDSCAKQTTLL